MPRVNNLGRRVSSTLHSAVLHRWLDIGALSFIGVVLLPFLFSLVEAYLGSVCVRFGLLPNFLFHLLWVLLVTFLLIPIALVVRPSWKHFRVVHKHPPSWVAGPIAATAFALLSTAFGLEPRIELPELVFAVAVVSFALLLLGWYLRLKPSADKWESESAVDEHGISHVNRQSDDLTKWLSNELPLRAIADDRFGHRNIARRIARILIEGANQKREVSIGLIGPFGVGKSSIINFVNAELNEFPNNARPCILLCRVSCWGFEDSAAALEHTLAQILGMLDEYVDTMCIRSVPESYRRALSSGGSWWEALSEAFNHLSDPGSYLDRLTPVLAAIDAHMVVALEDVDRNPSKSFDPQQIQSLLQRLRETERLSFILTTGSTLDGQYDFAKLCDHIELLNPLPPGQVAQLIRTLRTHCRRQPFIDAVSLKQREDFEKRFLRTSDDLEDISLYLGRTAEFEALASIVGTPRTLKHVLRELDSTWRLLCGEIDLDDAILVLALRHGAPEAFDFLVEHRKILRIELDKSETSQRKQVTKERVQRIRRGWESRTANVTWNPEHALCLVEWLVPSSGAYFKDRHTGGNEVRLQGVRHGRPTDYLQRILAGQIDDDAMSDQSLLKIIAKANTGDCLPLASAMVASSNTAELWEHFSSQLDDACLLPLASEIISELFKRDANHCVGDHHALIPVWRQYHKRGLDRDENTKQWLIDHLDRALPVSVRMANDLYYFWGSSELGIVTTEDKKEVRASLVNAAKRSFLLHTPESLVSALSEKSPFSLRHLIFPASSKEPEDVLVAPNDWTWISPVILAAAETAPEIVLPQLALLVGKYSMRHDDPDVGPKNIYELDRDAIEKMFGDSADAAIRLLATDIENGEPEVEEFLLSASRQARAVINAKVP